MATLPYISVIITAYHRKDFLLKAIESVINQTLDRKLYEIIVIKNFKDESIDSYIVENNVIGILSDEKSLGGKIIEALSISQGEVISFLEDDDLFDSSKLAVIYNKFKEDADLVYYHNDHVPIFELGYTHEYRKNENIVFNLSSVSVLRNIVLDLLRKVNVAADEFMYLFALESGKKIVKGSEKLTYYRIHKSLSNPSTVSEKMDFMEGQMKNELIPLRELFKAKRAIKCIDAKITDREINLILHGREEKPERLMNYLLSKYFRPAHRIKFFISAIIYKINPNVMQRLKSTIKVLFVKIPILEKTFF